MTIDADSIFDESFAELGGRFNEETLGDLGSGTFSLERGELHHVPGIALVPNREYLAFYRRRAERWLNEFSHLPSRRSTAPPTHFDYIDSHELNAVAISRSGLDLIGVNLGTLCTLHFLFSRLLARPYCLPSLHGSDERPDNPWPLVSGSPYDWRSFMPGDKPPGPLSVVRNRCIVILMMDAFDFIVLHEAAHLWNGHCDFTQSYYGGDRVFSERSSRRLTPGILSQCLEQNADCFALVNMVHIVTERVGNRDLGTLFPTLDFSLEHLFFAVYTVWRVFAESTPKASLDSFSHLPPRLRQWANLLTTAAGMHQDISIEQTATIWAGVAISIETAFKEMVSSADPGPVRDLADPKALDHVEAVHKLWTELHPEIEPFARYEGLPARIV